jgi:hypothetical protein
MADIFEMLVDILKINQNLVYEYSSQGALYQLFYLILFPTLFIVIFIWILSNKVMSQHKGLRLLLAVGVYAFIILQGYYSWFVMFSKYWLFGLIVLGFLYMISYRGGGIMGGGGAKPKTLPGNLSFGKILDQVNPFGDYQNEVDMVKTNINFIYSKVVEDKKLGRAGHYEEIINETHRTIDKLAERVSLKRKNPQIKKMKDNLTRAMEGRPPQW